MDRTNRRPRREQPAHAPGRTVSRGEWTYSPGVLTYGEHNIARLDLDDLEDLYLPKRKIEAATIMARYPGDAFVRAQFIHYGVNYDEDDGSCRGTNPLHTALYLGDFGRVPREIRALEDELYDEWEAVWGFPQYKMDKHFLTNGRADPTKNPQGTSACFAFFRIEEAKEFIGMIEAIDGLHWNFVDRTDSFQLFAGWDLALLHQQMQDFRIEKNVEEDPQTREQWVIRQRLIGLKNRTR